VVKGRLTFVGVTVYVQSDFLLCRLVSVTILCIVQCKFFEYGKLLRDGFGGLGVVCWPLVPKFAGSNPAEAVGFLGRKISSAHLPSEGK